MQGPNLKGFLMCVWNYDRRDHAAGTNCIFQNGERGKTKSEGSLFGPDNHSLQKDMPGLPGLNNLNIEKEKANLNNFPPILLHMFPALLTWSVNQVDLQFSNVIYIK